MTVYVIVQLKMIDRTAYDRYQARFFDVFKKFDGRLLSADESPAILEGAWNHDKLVLMSFPDDDAFQSWANSPECLEISKDRTAGRKASYCWQRDSRAEASAQIELAPTLTRPAKTGHHHGP